MKLYVVSSHENRHIEATLKGTLNIPLLSRRSKTKSLNYSHSLSDLAPGLTLSGSNYPYLEQSSMVPKMFGPLKFDCNENPITEITRLPTMYYQDYILLLFHCKNLLHRIDVEKLILVHQNICSECSTESPHRGTLT